MALRKSTVLSEPSALESSALAEGDGRPKVLRESGLLKLDNTSPGTLEKPAFVMNCPFSYNTNEPNNVWMREIDDENRCVDRNKAIAQFAQLYHYIAAEGIVFLLPAPRNCRLQDLVFTANLGIVLEHMPERDVVVLSNFTSEPRVGETKIGQKFFEAMGYRTIVAPHKFEGEAELKHLHDNVYVGGYGFRSDQKVYNWFEREFDMRVIKVREVDEYLYHLDCTLFPITSEDTLVCTELLTKSELAKLAKATNVIQVSADAAFSGICNSLRYHNLILNSSHIHTLQAGSEDYGYELKKNRELEDICAKLGLEISYFNLSEYHKSGALLSCMVMHLNRHSSAFRLI
jgi:N-dimethylarginine dimethylaminohydrolase